MVKVQHRLVDFLGYYNLKYDGGTKKQKISLKTSPHSCCLEQKKKVKTFRPVIW